MVAAFSVYFWNCLVPYYITSLNLFQHHTASICILFLFWWQRVQAVCSAKRHDETFRNMKSYKSQSASGSWGNVSCWIKFSTNTALGFISRVGKQNSRQYSLCGCLNANTTSKAGNCSLVSSLPTSLEKGMYRPEPVYCLQTEHGCIVMISHALYVCWEIGRIQTHNNHIELLFHISSLT